MKTAIEQGIADAWVALGGVMKEVDALKQDADGGVTMIIQNESPGTDKEANWLPAPKGPFAIYLRLYWPKAEAVDGRWTPPPLQRSK